MSISIAQKKHSKKGLVNENVSGYSNGKGLTIQWPFRRKKTFKDKQKARVFADLFLLRSSGLDINATLEILQDQAQNDWERTRFQGIREQIISGETLARAMKEYGLAGDYEYYSLKIGEESGKIVEVLDEINRYYERKIQQRRQLSGAITYPAMVLITAFVAVGFMLNVIVPMFEEVFKRFDGDLPVLTQRIIQLSDGFKQYFWLILLCIFALLLGIRRLARVKRIKQIWQSFLLRLPTLGVLIRMMQSARFCHIMTLLTSAKAPLVQSLQMVGDMIGFLPLKNSIHKIEEDISNGKTLFSSVESVGFFDRKFISLIKAGEEVNQLEYAFSRLNNQYNQEIDHRLSILSHLLEPILIVIVGGMVAVILIAMYLPLFQIGSSIY